MAWPTKSVARRTGHMSKKDIDTRLEYEAKLRGDADKIRPPSFLTLPQRKIFKGLVEYLMPAGLLGNIDVHIVAQAAVTINRVQECEKIINETGLVDDEGNINPQVKIKSGYMSEFFRICNELCLSPQARAKLANINANAEAEKVDPLLSIIRGND